MGHCNRYPTVSHPEISGIENTADTLTSRAKRAGPKNVAQIEPAGFIRSAQAGSITETEAASQHGFVGA
ncbi:MAG: hypothetical protein V3S41_00140 [Spirochaetia bacterium]